MPLGRLRAGLASGHRPGTIEDAETVSRLRAAGIIERFATICT
jgi:hypothetical protein